ncbi:MAG TPA: hypothetical protein VII01_13575, partial [Solirubrobacteraceae bacterium]
GLELLAALLLGIPALLWGLGRAAEAEQEPGPEREPARGLSAEGTPAAGGPAATASTAEPARPAVPPAPGPSQANPRGPLDRAPADALRVRRAVAAGLGLWMLTGIVLFSHMERLHPRYVESFTPAVAAMLGIGIAWVASRRGMLRLGVLVAGLAITIYYAERLLYGRPDEWWIALAGALGAIAFAALARVSGPPSRLRSLLAPGGVMAMTLIAVLAVPVSADITAINNHVTDAGYVGALPTEEQQPLSAYLRANQRGARYEVAAESATQIGSLIVQDARPILVLTTYNGRVFTTVAQLQSLIAKGEVRYAFLNTFCSRHAASVNPACSAPAKWIRAHATDVSRQAGLAQHKTLYLLPGATP